MKLATQPEPIAPAIDLTREERQRVKVSRGNAGRPGVTPLWLRIERAIIGRQLRVGREYDKTEIAQAIGASSCDLGSLGNRIIDAQYDLAIYRSPYVLRETGITERSAPKRWRISTRRSLAPAFAAFAVALSLVVPLAGCATAHPIFHRPDYQFQPGTLSPEK